MGMQSGGKVRGRHYVALLMSLLLMMTAWQTLAIAAEGDVEEPVVAAEEVVPEADAAVETEEAVETDETAATGDEEAVPERDALTEGLQEPVESGQVEDEAATEMAVPEAEEQVSEQAIQEDVDSQLDGGLLVQSSGYFSYANDAIEGYVYTGEATYDKASNTLTLNAATMSNLTINMSVTIKLVGDNKVESSLNVVGEGVTLTFEGGGKLSYGRNLIVGRAGYNDGDYYYDDDYYDESAQPMGNVIIKGGTIVCDEIYAKTLTMKGGSVSGGVECTTFRMYEGAKLSAKGSDDDEPLVNCTTFAMWGGTVTLTNCHKGIGASEKFSLAGGTITVKGSSDGGWNEAAIEAGTSFYMQGGTIATSGFDEAVSTKAVTIKGGSVTGDIGEEYETEVGSFTMSGGTVKGDVYAKAVTMSKGTITGKVDCAGTMKLSGGTVSYAGTGSDDDLSGVSATTLSMTGGTIKVSKCNTGITVSKSFAMSKGTVSVANCDYGISAEQYANAKTANITIKGGKVTITNPSETGIEAAKGNITMTGGTVSVTGAYENALYAWGDAYRGTKYGGRIKVTGGKLTAKVRKPSQNSALLAIYGVSNKTTCLGAIAGGVSKGTSFKVGGNTYKLYDYSQVRLVKYESTKTSASLTRVRFGGNTYDVYGVAKNAFATKQGKKLKSLSFGNYLNYLGAYAFKGTSSLTTLRLNLNTNEKWTNSGSISKVTTDKAYGTYAKTAFKGAGKNGGKGLTVKMTHGEFPAYRTYLRSLGLSSGAKVVEHY